MNSMLQKYVIEKIYKMPVFRVHFCLTSSHIHFHPKLFQNSNVFLSSASPAGKSANAANVHIIEQLEDMMKSYRNMGDEFRMYAYARAISAIRKYPKPIVSAQVSIPIRMIFLELWDIVFVVHLL